MEKQTKEMLKAIVEQNIMHSDYIRDRKDWFNLYHLLDKEEPSAKRISKVVIVGYFAAILTATFLSAYLFTHLPSVTN